MPIEFKVRAVKIGGSTRMTIPLEICEAMNIKPGDTLSVSLTDHEILVKKK